MVSSIVAFLNSNYNSVMCHRVAKKYTELVALRLLLTLIPNKKILRVIGFLRADPNNLPNISSSTEYDVVCTQRTEDQGIEGDHHQPIRGELYTKKDLPLQ